MKEHKVAALAVLAFACVHSAGAQSPPQACKYATRMTSGQDVALVAYKVHEELTVEGELLTLESAESSVWVRREGGWRCAMHSESILGDPFGRDRIPEWNADERERSQAPHTSI